MADKLLSGLRLQLIEGVSEALLKDLIDGLQASNPPVLTGREANQILQAKQVLEDRVGELVDVVRKKGDEASVKMLSIVELKDQHLAEQLKLMQKPQKQKQLLKGKKEAMGPKTADVTDEEYPMTSTPRGFCLIINNTEFEDPTKNLTECVKDTGKLKDVFTFLGFTVDIQENLTAQQMENLILDYSEMETHGDCFVCCVLSHGCEEGVLGTDLEPCALDNIFSPFDGKKCPPLVGKPKVFFIDACRGGKRQEPVQNKNAGIRSMNFYALEKSNTITKHSDFLVSMATVENYVSYVNDSGSWFIQSLCKHLRDGSQRGEDILTILTKVNDDVSTMQRTVEVKETVWNNEGKTVVEETVLDEKMTPESRFTLRKKLIFRIP